MSNRDKIKQLVFFCGLYENESWGYSKHLSHFIEFNDGWEKATEKTIGNFIYHQGRETKRSLVSVIKRYNKAIRKMDKSIDDLIKQAKEEQC